MKGLSEEEVPVLYQISNLDNHFPFYFKLDNEDYSLFPSEQEVLLRPGSFFEINEISE